MTIPFYKINEDPSLLNAARTSDYLYNDTDTVFNLANLYFIKLISNQNLILVNMASGKTDLVSFLELKSGNWQINLIPDFIRKHLGLN